MTADLSEKVGDCFSSTLAFWDLGMALKVIESICQTSRIFSHSNVVGRFNYVKCLNMGQFFEGTVMRYKFSEIVDILPPLPKRVVSQSNEGYKNNLEWSRYPNCLKRHLSTQSSSNVLLEDIQLQLDAIVKVFAVASSPNYFLPWQNKPQRESTGSGFSIAKKLILTNAHVVADQTFVLVRKHGSPVKYRAGVKAVGHDCDLALLSVEQEDFWKDMPVLEMGDVPELQEEVAVVGYPQGGDNISVTSGVVSRVELTQYVHGASHLMAIQIDAAINPGNSGGPAIMDGKVAGVAFQNLPNAENIGYIIPTTIVQHFLSIVETKEVYDGFCSLGVSCQALENSQLRSHLKVPPGGSGVLVNRIHPLSPSKEILRKDDVLLAFDGEPIAHDGTVQFRNRERIAFDYLVSLKKAGDVGLIKFSRNGEIFEKPVKIQPLSPLVPVHHFDRLPSYFIFAGLVFTPLSQPYLHEYGEDWFHTSPRKLCDQALTAVPTREGQQLIILSQVLADDINAGYERLSQLQVKRVNGTEVDNLRHLKDLIFGVKGGTVRIDLDEDRVMALDREEAEVASQRILKMYRIPSVMSEDLET